MLKKITLAVILLFLLLLGAIFLFAKDIEISVSEEDAQAAINEFLLAGSQKRNGILVSPENISIDFKSDNHAEVTGMLDLDGYGYTGTFDGTFAAGINYRRPSLYLNDLSLMEGGFQTDEETHSDLNDMKKVAIDVLRRQRERIKTDNSGKPLNTSEEKSAEIIEEFVQSATKRTFENIPIYNISRAGSGGFAASIALKDVSFTEEAAIVTLSPVTALLRILAAFGSTCLFLLWFWMQLGFPFAKKRNLKD